MNFELRAGWHFTFSAAERLVVSNEEKTLSITAPKHVISEILNHIVRLQPLSTMGERLATELVAQGPLQEKIELGVLSTRYEMDYKQAKFIGAHTDLPKEAMKRIKNTCVLLLGLGGIGAEALRLLVAAGFEKYILIDRDVVETSNLNRQTIYRLQDVGKPKVEVCIDYIKDRNENASVQAMQRSILGPPDIKEILNNNHIDVALVGIDEPLPKILVDTSQILSERGIRFVVAGVGVRYGQIGVDYVHSSDQPVMTTDASLSTTNTIVASWAAHRMIEIASNVELPFATKEI